LPGVPCSTRTTHLCGRRQRSDCLAASDSHRRRTHRPHQAASAAEARSRSFCGGSDAGELRASTVLSRQPAMRLRSSPCLSAPSSSRRPTPWPISAASHEQHRHSLSVPAVGGPTGPAFPWHDPDDEHESTQQMMQGLRRQTLVFSSWPRA
jgi:hypothetical protein